MIFSPSICHLEKCCSIRFCRNEVWQCFMPLAASANVLSLSMGLAVASGSPLLRWQAPRRRRVLYVDGEMPLVSLQERLRAISTGLGAVIPNDGFRVLAADSTETVSQSDRKRGSGQSIRCCCLGLADLQCGGDSHRKSILKKRSRLLQNRRTYVAIQPSNAVIFIRRNCAEPRFERNRSTTVHPIPKFFKMNLKACTLLCRVILGSAKGKDQSRASSRRDVPRLRPFVPA